MIQGFLGSSNEEVSEAEEKEGDEDEDDDDMDSSYPYHPDLQVYEMKDSSYFRLHWTSSLHFYGIKALNTC